MDHDIELPDAAAAGVEDSRGPATADQHLQPAAQQEQEVDQDGPVANNQNSSNGHGSEQEGVVEQGPPSSVWKEIYCIEHPGIVKDVDNGIQSLGGPTKISKALKYQSASIALSLRPEDSLAKKVLSHGIQTHDILLKVIAPARTGRRRKRGSGADWEDDPTFDPDSNSSQPLMRALRDNPDSYTVDTVGVITGAHRFRALPDYQYATTTSKMMTNIRRNLLHADLPAIQRFKISPTKHNLIDQGIPPPPQFSDITVPVQWSYRQNPLLEFYTDDKGNLRSHLASRFQRKLVHVVPFDGEVPTHPPAHLPPLRASEPVVRRLVKQMRELLAKRPIITKRAIGNLIGREDADMWRHAIGHVGYFFKSGPWRDAIIKFGIDPRTDPKYRIYQTMTFKLGWKEVIEKWKKDQASDKTRMYEHGQKKWLAKHEGASVENGMGHIFNGKKIIPDGKIYQMCDFTDPVLKPLVETHEHRDECEMQWSGWYGNGTFAKIKAIAKDRLYTVLLNKEPEPEEVYERLLKLPEFLTKENQAQAMFGKKSTEKELDISSDVRNIAMWIYREENKAKGIIVDEYLYSGAGQYMEEEEADEEDRLDADVDDEDEDSDVERRKRMERVEATLDDPDNQGSPQSLEEVEILKDGEDSEEDEYEEDGYDDGMEEALIAQSINPSEAESSEYEELDDEELLAQELAKVGAGDIDKDDGAMGA